MAHSNFIEWMANYGCHHAISQCQAGFCYHVMSSIDGNTASGALCWQCKDHQAVLFGNCLPLAE